MILRPWNLRTWSLVAAMGRRMVHPPPAVERMFGTAYHLGDTEGRDPRHRARGPPTSAGRTMGSGKAEIDIDKSADDVWAVIGDFGGVVGWMPGIESCRVEGENRILRTMGMTITERLVSKDDAVRALTYSIADGAPVESHEAVITVTPTGDTSHVTWVVDATPDEMADLMATIYQQALDALKAHVEG
jgi:carbon monoxide dehydrogenase subunit G